MLFTLAWRNLWRNRSRTLITMASVASAVVLAVVVVSLQKGVFDNLVKNVAGFYTGYVQVNSKDYLKEQTLENSFPLTDSLVQILKNEPGLAGYAPRLESFMLLSQGEKTKGCMVVGIDPEAENSVTNLASKVTEGQFLQDGAPALLVAEGLAHQLGARIGDTLVLLGQSLYGSTAAGKYPVAGYLHFGSPELNNRLVYMPVSEAQTMFDAGENVTSLVLLPARGKDYHRTATSLSARVDTSLTVQTWEDKMPEVVQYMKTDSAGMYMVLGVLYLLISFGIFSTLLMMLAERRREFGMLVALGMKRGLLARLTMLESILVSLTGCLAGLILSFPIVAWMHAYPIRMGGELAKTYEKFGFEPVFPAIIKTSIFVNQTLTVLVVALVLSVYPMWHILRLNTVQAMRA